MAATTGEPDRATLYHRSRPPYADDVADFAVRDVSGGMFAVVADIGCGTGLSTRTFARIAQGIVAVEPNAGMRSIARSSLANLRATVVAGSAEATGIAPASVDLLVAASCFEWFNRRRAAREFRRVLAPSGQVLLMWNHRVVVNHISHELDRLWLRHMGPRLGPTRSEIDHALVPAFLGPRYTKFTKIDYHRFDLCRLADFANSSSYAPQQPQQRRLRALDEALRAFHARHESDGAVSLPFETVAFVGHPALWPHRTE
jgi:SAM-dependent methyltransferase